MNAVKKAMEIRERGCNCAQSVFGACEEYTGLSEQQALAVSAGFGAGLGCGEICGALSGAVMAMGASLPSEGMDEKERKEKAKDCARELCGKFKERYGCLTCAELKGNGISCDELIEYGAELAEAMIKENNSAK